MRACLPRRASAAVAAALLGLAASARAGGGGATETGERELLRAEADRFEARVNARGLVYADPQLTPYLDGLVSLLASQSTHPEIRYHAVVLNNPNDLAFVLQNGAIFVGAGAFVRLEDEAQLALVLAQNISRVELDHIVQQSGAPGPEIGARRAFFAAFGYALPDLDTRGALVAFSPDRTAAADRTGMAWIAQAGFATSSASHVWSLLAPAAQYREQLANHLVQSGEIAANPSGRNDAGRMRSATAAVALESVRLALARERYDFALSGVERVRTRYGDSALLCYYEGESLLRVAALPRDVVRAMEARNSGDRRDELPDLHARRRLRAGVPPQLAQAEQSFRLALQRDPGLAAARSGLGEVQLLKGDLAGARATLAEYLAANPGAPDARLVEKMLASVGGSGDASAAP